MNALENEKRNENTVAFDFSEYDSSKEEKHQKVIKRNYNLTRIEANHGTVQPIKDKEDIDTTTYKVGDNVYFLAQSGFNIELPEGTFRLINIQEVLVGEKS